MRGRQKKIERAILIDERIYQRKADLVRKGVIKRPNYSKPCLNMSLRNFVLTMNRKNGTHDVCKRCTSHCPKRLRL